MRLYRYVGPRQIAERVRSFPPGTPITSPADVVKWARVTGQRPLPDGCIIATFVVSPSGVLRIADRCSEHVACAGGRSVQSAGEITFALHGEYAEVVAVSNQSCGYCPEPISWLAVQAALSRVGFLPPEGFSLVCVFRRCQRCGSICVVKGEVFECGACGSELPETYNCQDETNAEPGAAADRPRE